MSSQRQSQRNLQVQWTQAETEPPIEDNCDDLQHAWHKAVYSQYNSE